MTMDVSGRYARWLALAATPTFAIMALLCHAGGSAQADMICSSAHASGLGSMVSMYLLMSAFHSAPWFRLIIHWRHGGRGA